MKLKEKFQRFWTLSKSHEGFTLVELIVVIAILAILAGVAIPVYNGYIKKAQTAADQTLLDSVNTSFAAACAENGLSQYDITEAKIKIEADGTIGVTSGETTSYVQKAVTATENVTADINEAFAFYYAGNENAAFNTFTYLTYDNEKGIFVDGGDAIVTLEYGGGYVTISKDAIAALQDSSYLKNLTSEDLLNQVNSVAGVAGGMGSLLSIMGGSDFQNSAAAALGVDATQLDAKKTELAKEALKKQGYTDEQISAMSATDPALVQAETAVMSNALILYTAQNTTKMNAEDAKALLNGANGSSIAANMGSDDVATNQKGINQAALAYGMYYAYVNSEACTDANIKGDSNIQATDVISALDSNTEFQNYMNSEQGEKDMNAYLAALETVNSSTDSAAAVEKLMINGFNDADLVKILTDTLGK